MAIIKYAIADDHKIFRKGLKLALSDDHHIKCIGEAENGLQLLQLLAGQKTDVVLLDLKMPEMDGMETIKHLRDKYPDVKIIVLTMSDDEPLVMHLMESGANGFLVKNAEPAEIINAIHAAFNNGYYFNDHVSNIMLKGLVQKNKIEPRFKPSIQLTEKERDVLNLICKEHTNVEIGEKIYLSPRTVEGIRSTLLEKIGVRNTAGLVIYAVKNGIYEM